MITNFLLTVITSVVSSVDALLPSFSLPSFFASGSLIPSGVVQLVASALYSVSPWFPSSLLLSILVAAASLWPAVLGYIVFQWIWKHTPTIAGFGLGDG